jgi:hypothetical protein
MRNFALAAAAAVALFCSPPALAQINDGLPTGAPQMTPDVTMSVKTISALCASPTSGCAAGQFASIKLGGRNAVTAQVITSNFTGTLTPYASTDNGATWFAISLRTVIGSVSSAAASSILSADTSTKQYAIFVPYGGATDVMLASTAAVTNTLTVQLTATNTNPGAMLTLIAPKGLQSLNGVGLTTQDLKDASRSYVVFSADGVTPAIAETVITFTKIVADTTTTAQTTYTITNAKTFRLQAICASMTAGAAANRVRVALRLNTGGACVAGSNILLPVAELAPQYGTAAAAEGGAYVCQPIPDGLEITGNGTKAICLSENAVAASGTLTVNLVGYEY